MLVKVKVRGADQLHYKDPDTDVQYQFMCSVTTATSFCCSTGQVGNITIDKRRSLFESGNGMPFDPLNILDMEFLGYASAWLNTKTRIGEEYPAMPRWVAMLRSDHRSYTTMSYLLEEVGFVPVSSYSGRGNRVICYDKSREFQVVSQ